MLKGIIRHLKFALKVISVQEVVFHRRGLVRVVKVIIVLIISCLSRQLSFLSPFLAILVTIVLEQATLIRENVSLGLTVQQLVEALVFCVKLGSSVLFGG